MRRNKQIARLSQGNFFQIGLIAYPDNDAPAPDSPVQEYNLHVNTVSFAIIPRLWYIML